ncbi:MAG: dihydroorotase [Desulfobacterium sp.]|nr:dihydroorotase [Desulfobacterium sp.]MBU3949101.1 dihydroorotase [Pseudomonadota bacterium]MBU4037495.1 dihydroorotase [Pseudomonadota bacterium]
MLTLIKGGRVIDPGNLDGVMDILIKNDRIIDITPLEKSEINSSELLKKQNAIRIIDAFGKIVVPGLIDMHVHLREPGQEYKETIETGTLAAAAGGFTSVCAMPNTIPVNDNRQITEYILNRARNTGKVNVYPVAAISIGLKGNRLCEYGDLKDAGVIAISDDGNPVLNSRLMRRAMEYAKGFGLPVISHCEISELSSGGSMNEGVVATRMGLAGIPNEAESIMVARDIALCELTGAHLHIAHVSTSQSVSTIRDAKKRGVSVTAETAPHYFTLTEDAVCGYNTNAKMNPPLRSAADRDAIREGLADGTIDVIATDHAPHSSLEKDVEFDMAANGIVGLETSVSLGLKLVEERIISLTVLIEKMSSNPARILHLDKSIKKGNVADITIIDTNLSYTVDSNSFFSLGRNTPFNEWEMKGRACLAMVGGKIVFENMIS